MCDPFIYSAVENRSCSIKVDIEFIKSAILKSEQFYLKHYLPYLYNTFNNENVDANNKNNQLHTVITRSFTDLLNTRLGSRQLCYDFKYII